MSIKQGTRHKTHLFQFVVRRCTLDVTGPGWPATLYTMTNRIWYDNYALLVEKSIQKTVIILWITCTTVYIIFVLLLIQSAFISSNRTNIQNEARFTPICSCDIFTATWSAAKPFTIWNTIIYVICAITYNTYWHSRTKFKAIIRFNGHHFKWRIRKSTNLRVNAKCFQF